ncbi:single-pass membrane and coiled-coil domain-containing protein 2 [Sarcophilus harrisii]
MEIFSQNSAIGERIQMKEWRYLLGEKEAKKEVEKSRESIAESGEKIEETMFYKLNYWNSRMFLQVKELGIDHKDWIEKNDIIVQKINATEEAVKNLLNEVIEMENQMEQLESNQYLEIEEELSKQSYCNWKLTLWTFVFIYVFIIFGFSCYVFFIDPTFIFETMLPRILGRRRMWELKELIAPFLNLEVDDLLPS